MDRLDDARRVSGPEALGLLEPSELARRWVDPATGPAPERRRALERELARLDGDPRGRLTRGAILLALARPAEAAQALAGVTLPAAARWRAEAALQTGDPEGALAHLSDAPGEACLRGLALFTAGRAAPARAALNAARGAEAALAAALLGLFAARAGDAAAAEAAFARAARLAPGQAWPAGLRASAALALAEPPLRALLAVLDDAVAREPEAAWLRRLRGEARQRDGQAFAAHEDLDRAVALSLPHAQLLLQRGQLLYMGKRYDEAIADFTAAARLSPGDAQPLWHRALARWSLGDVSGARADAAACAALAPEDPEYRFGLRRFTVLGGAPAAARAALARDLRSGPAEDRAGALFLLGQLDFHQGRYKAARARFLEAERLVEEKRSVRKFADLGYSLIAGAFSKGGRMTDKTKAGKNGTLYITGLGLDYPGQTTLEVMRALSRCDVLFANLSGPHTLEFLTLFCKDVRPVSYRAKDDEGRWIDAILKAAKPGRTLGFVTRGHPLVSGWLGDMLGKRAAAAGLSVRVFSAVSSIDDILAASKSALSVTMDGLQAYESRLVAEGGARVPPRVGVILYLSVKGDGSDAPAHLDALAAALSARFPKEHPVSLYSPPYGTGKLESVPLKALRARLAKTRPDMLSSTVLYLPPAR